MRSHLDAPVQEQQQSTSQAKAPMASPNYREEAERIVADERAQSEKMPVYEVRRSVIRHADIQGLEGFRLVEKMGDGAFSNVYKAVDRKTGRKVAVKVVRKYELNHSQVSFLSRHSLCIHPYIYAVSYARARLGTRRHRFNPCPSFFFLLFFQFLLICSRLGLVETL